MIRDAIRDEANTVRTTDREDVLITSTETVGRTAGHTDVSFWYVLKGDRGRTLNFDQSEFRSVRWFHQDTIPFARK